MNYTRTYSQLKDFTCYIESVNPKPSTICSIIQSQVLGPNSDAARVHLGRRFFGLDVDTALNEFRSNRFFLDAVGAPLMPTQKALIDCQSIIEGEAHSVGVSKKIDSLLDNFIDEEFQNFNSNDTPAILKGHRMPSVLKGDLDFLDQNGYLIVENAIPSDLCDYLRDRLLMQSKIEEKSVRGGYFYGSGRMQRVYCLLAKDAVFQELLMHPICHHVMSHMFHRNTYHDKYYLTSFHGNILKPGAEPQIWHIDANVPEPLPPWIIRANSNYVIEDLTDSNGATEIVLGSHELKRKPTKIEAEKHDFEIKKMCAPKGSLIFWHGHLWHRSGANKSESERPALLAAYAASFFREVCLEENPYLYASNNTSSSFPLPLKRLLGWEHGAKNYV